MKFFELAVGDHFRYNGVAYVKVKEERISCCKVGKNAVLYGSTNSSEVLKPLEEVEKLNPETLEPLEKPTGHTAPARPE